MEKKNKNPLGYSVRTLLPVFLLFISLQAQACFSSVAVKGVPVEDLAVLQKEKRTMRALTTKDREELAKMSKTKENKVFKVIEGFPEYRIGPLDVLQVNSRVGEKVKTSIVTVNSLGRMFYSFIDNLNVNGLTPSQLDDLLTEKLSHYIKKPRIDVIMKGFNSKSAMVLGEFASLRGGQYGKTPSGNIRLKGRTTLMDFLAQAGGYTDRGNIKDLRFTRGSKAYHINLYDIITRGDDTVNVIIDQGDILDIPDLGEFRNKVYVLGEVESQGVYDLKDAQDLLAALAMAGSYTIQAKESNTLVVRATEPGKKPLIMMANVKALLREGDLRQNIPLKDGDLVYVPPMVIKDVNDFIEYMNPLLNFIFWPDRYRSTYWVNDWWKAADRSDTYLER